MTDTLRNRGIVNPVAKSMSTGYKIPKRDPPPTKRVTSFGDFLMTLNDSANNRKDRRKIRLGSTDCSPRSDTSSGSSISVGVTVVRTDFNKRRIDIGRPLNKVETAPNVGKDSSRRRDRSKSKSHDESHSRRRHKPTPPSENKRRRLSPLIDKKSRRSSLVDRSAEETKASQKSKSPDRRGSLSRRCSSPNRRQSHHSLSSRHYSSPKRQSSSHNHDSFAKVIAEKKTAEYDRRHKSSNKFVEREIDAKKPSNGPHSNVKLGRLSEDEKSCKSSETRQTVKQEIVAPKRDDKKDSSCKTKQVEITATKPENVAAGNNFSRKSTNDIKIKNEKNPSDSKPGSNINTKETVVIAQTQPTKTRSIIVHKTAESEGGSSLPTLQTSSEDGIDDGDIDDDDDCVDYEKNPEQLRLLEERLQQLYRHRQKPLQHNETQPDVEKKPQDDSPPWLLPLSLDEIFRPPPMIQRLESMTVNDIFAFKNLQMFAPPPMLSDIDDSEADEERTADFHSGEKRATNSESLWMEIPPSPLLNAQLKRSTTNVGALFVTVPEAVKDDVDDESIYCICRSRNEISRPMVQCEACLEWFHFICIGYFPTPKEVEEEPFLCPDCKI